MPEQKLFTIPPNCPHDKRAIFQRLNAFLEESGVSADELDLHFRRNMVKTAFSLSARMAADILHAYEKKHDTKLAFEGREEIEAAEAKANKMFAAHGYNPGNSWPTIDTALPNNERGEAQFPQSAETLLNIVTSLNEESHETMAGCLDILSRNVGRFQDYDDILLIDPQGLLSDISDDAIPDVTDGNGQKIDAPRLPAPKRGQRTNLLQEIVNGDLSFISADTPSVSWRFSHTDPADPYNINVSYSDTSYYAGLSLANALVDTIIEKKKKSRSPITRATGQCIDDVVQTIDKIHGKEPVSLMEVWPTEKHSGFFSGTIGTDSFQPRAGGGVSFQGVIPIGDLLGLPPRRDHLPGLRAPVPPGGTVGARASMQLVAPPPPEEALARTIFKGPDSYQNQNSPDLDEAHKNFFKALDKLHQACAVNAAFFEFNIRDRMTTMLSNLPVIAESSLCSRINSDYGTTLPLIHPTKVGVSNSPTIALLMRMKFPIESLTGNNTTDLVARYNLNDQELQRSALNGVADEIRFHLFQKIESVFPFLDMDGNLSGLATAKIQSLLVANRAALNVNLRPFNPNRSVFTEFRNGTRKLREFSAEPTRVEWEHYQISFPSERDFVLHAIEQSALSFENQSNKRAIQSALAEVKAAYEEACLSPQEREERAEQQRLAAEQAEAARQNAIKQKAAADAAAAEKMRQQEEQKLLEFKALVYGPEASSLFDRAKATTSGDPQKKQDALVLGDVVARELHPLRDNLNRNFPLHQEFGEAMFGGTDFGVVRALDNICCETSKKSGARDTTKNAALWRQMLEQNFDDTPLPETATREEQFKRRLEQANKDRHGVIVKALENAPVLIVAAMGSEKQIGEMGQIQRTLVALQKDLIPRKKRADLESPEVLIQRRAWLAKKVLQENNLPVPEALNVAEPPPKPVAAKPAPPVKPVAPPPPAVVGAPAQVIADTSSPVDATIIPVITTSTTTTEPPAPPTATTAPTIPATPEEPLPSAPAEPAKPAEHPSWASIRDTLDNYVLTNAWQDQKHPYNMLQSSMPFANGEYGVTLHFSRWNEDSHGHRSTETISTTIRLGENDYGKALALKEKIQTYLMELGLYPYIYRHGNGHGAASSNDILPNIPPETNLDGGTGRLVKRGGVYALRLTFQDPAEPENSVSTTVPLGVAVSDSVETAKERSALVLGHLEEHRKGSIRLTAEDLRQRLREDVQSYGGTWVQPATIDLSDYPDVQREVTIKFPYQESERAKQHLTKIIVGNPTLAGSPNSSWSIPLTVKVNQINNNGHRNVKESDIESHLTTTIDVNTHISDPDEAIRRIGEITEHFRTRLKRHGEKYPTAHWAVDETGKFEQYDASKLSQTHDIDRSRLDHMRDELSYAAHSCVTTSEPIQREDGRYGFHLTVTRADGSLFREHESPENTVETKIMARHFVLPADITDAETAKEKANAFGKEAGTLFRDGLYDAYSPFSDPGFANGGHVPDGVSLSAGRKPMRAYNPATIISLFDRVCETMQLRHSETELDVAPSTQSLASIAAQDKVGCFVHPASRRIG